MALAGPLLHIPMAMLFANLLGAAGHPVGLADVNPLGEYHYPGSAPWHDYLYWAFKLQILLLCFNVCLPAYPLDGGQVLVGLLSTRLPVPVTATVAALVTLLVAGGLFVLAGVPLIAMLLAYEGVTLLSAARTGGLDWHPLSRLYSRPQVVELAPAVYVAPGQELVGCPSCGKLLHPRSELCVHCDARFPRG